MEVDQPKDESGSLRRLARPRAVSLFHVFSLPFVHRSSSVFWKILTVCFCREDIRVRFGMQPHVSERARWRACVPKCFQQWKNRAMLLELQRRVFNCMPWLLKANQLNTHAVSRARWAKRKNMCFCLNQLLSGVYASVL